MITRSQVKPAVVRSPVQPSFRPDIQGLRAVAVIAVILDHLFGWPSGGFIGVDVFFVISGYLITGLMLREHARTGRISWGGFYRRRFKRIIPASTVVLVATVAASYFIYRIARFESIVADSIWSFLFMANWHSAEIGTDYFQSDGPVSPLQHFWSLSVEEQFYLVWPALLIGVLALAVRQSVRRGRDATILLLAGVGGITLASFGWSIWETANVPTWAYFSTFSRAWELAVGALLAVTAATITRLPSRFRPLLSYTGLLAIVAGLFVISAGSAFPGPWAALPVLGAGVVIAAGIGGPPSRIWPLTNRASVYVGTISYSLYLWHFPVIVLLAALMPEGGVNYYVCAILVMLVLSVLSFHLIEDPIRRSSWLDARRTSPRGSARGPDEWDRDRRRRKTRLSLLGAGVALSVFAFVVALQVPHADPGMVLAQAAAAQTNSTASAAQPGTALSGVSQPDTIQDSAAGSASNSSPGRNGPAQQALAAQITGALAAENWPELIPSIDTLGPQDKAPEWVTDGCLGDEQGAIDDPKANTQRCLYGDPAASKTAVLLGDSVAISYLPGIRAALESGGWKIQVMTMEQCPFPLLEVLKGDGSPHAECDDFRQWTIDQVAALRPDLVLVSTATSTLGRLVGEPADSAALDEWKPALTASLDAVAGHAGKVMVLAAPPNTANLLRCATQRSVPKDCVGSPSDLYTSLTTVESDVVTAKGEGFDYVPTQQWFCSAEARCPSFIGGSPVFVDGGHLTGVFSKQLGPVIAEEINR